MGAPCGRKGAGEKLSHNWPSLAVHLPPVVPLPVTSTSEVPSGEYSVTPLFLGPTQRQLFPASMDLIWPAVTRVGAMGVASGWAAKSTGCEEGESLNTFMLAQAERLALKASSEISLKVMFTVKVPLDMMPYNTKAVAALWSGKAYLGCLPKFSSLGQPSIGQIVSISIAETSVESMICWSLLKTFNCTGADAWLPNQGDKASA